MAFYNKDISGNYELKKAMKIMKEFGQLTVKQLASVTDLNETEARMVMHRAYHEHLVREVTTDRYILNCDNGKGYNPRMELALNLAFRLCEENEQIVFDECIKDTEEPFLIYMGTDEADYDIIYVEEGKEKAVSNRIARLGGDSNVLAIIENKGQLDGLHIEKLCAVYLAKEGELEYVQ